MVCLDRAGSVFDGVLSSFEETLVAHVAQGVATGALTRVTRRLAAPACVCKGSANRWLDLADGDADLVRDGVIVVSVPEWACRPFGA